MIAFDARYMFPGSLFISQWVCSVGMVTATATTDLQYWIQQEQAMGTNLDEAPQIPRV